jgi:hypothetical protein
MLPITCNKRAKAAQAQKNGKGGSRFMIQTIGSLVGIYVTITKITGVHSL